MGLYCHIGFCQATVGLRGGLNVTPYDQFEVIGPTFGVDLVAQGANHHVISLVDFRSKYRETNEVLSFEFHPSISYQLEHHFQSKKRVHTSLGGLLLLKFDRVVVEPKFAAFKTNRMIFTSGLYALPGLHYELGKATVHFFVPIELVQYTFDHMRVDNPSIPRSQQINETNSVDLIRAKVSLMFSVGLLINR